MIDRFNVRVYGLLFNQNHQVLLSQEKYGNLLFTKFPGGGLEFGEGTVDCLMREFKEEFNVDIEVEKHFYTTDFFQQSAFVKTDQLLSIYYLVKCNFDNVDLRPNKMLTEKNQPEIKPFWQKLDPGLSDALTFPIDKLVAKLLLNSPTV